MDLGEYVHQAGVKVAQDALGAIESGQVRTRDELDEFVARGLGQSASDIAAMFTGTLHSISCVLVPPAPSDGSDVPEKITL